MISEEELKLNSLKEVPLLSHQYRPERHVERTTKLSLTTNFVALFNCIFESEKVNCTLALKHLCYQTYMTYT